MPTLPFSDLPRIPAKLPDDARVLGRLYRLHIAAHDGSSEHAQELTRLASKWHDVSVIGMTTAGSKQELFTACLFADPNCDEFPVGIQRILDSDLVPEDAAWLLAIASRFTSHFAEFRELLLVKAGELLSGDRDMLVDVLLDCVLALKYINKHYADVDISLYLLPLKDEDPDA